MELASLRLHLHETQPLETTLDNWLATIGSVGPGLRVVEISLGIWHLHNAAKDDGVVAFTLAKIAQLLKRTDVQCEISMRIGVPSPSGTPYSVDVRLSITDIIRAKTILKDLFDANIYQLDRLRYERQVSSVAFRILKRDLLQCQQRLDRFIHITAGPIELLPRWTKQDSEKLAVLLERRKGAEQVFDPAAGAGQEVVEQEDSSEFEDVDSLSRGEESCTYIGPCPQILCVRDVRVAREARDRVYEALPPLIQLRNPSRLSPTLLTAETTTTVDGPLTPSERADSPRQWDERLNVKLCAERPKD